MGALRNIGLCLCGALVLAACGGDSSGNDNTGGGVAISLFSPAAESPAIPFPYDLFFADATTPTGLSADGTLNIPNDDGAPFVADANRLDGFSTTASIFTDFLGAAIDLDSTDGGIVVINASTGEALAPGEDYRVVRSSVITSRPRLLIQPLAPLEPATRYVVIVTDALRTASGGNIQSSDQFLIVSDPDPVGSDGNPAEGFTAEQRATLELVRSQLVRPIFDGLISPPVGPDPTPNIGAGDVILTWSFTTQSVGDSLELIAENPTAGGISVQNIPSPPGEDARLSTGELGLGLPDTANIYQGTLELPYYLAPASGPNDDAPLGTFWASNGAGADGDSGLIGPEGPIPCAAFEPSESTTKCFPQPVEQATVTVPVIVTVPRAEDNSDVDPGDIGFADGFPVVVFQHGITGNRTNVFPLAPTLASAGFVTVAIDLPLHGVLPDDALFYQAGNERTFDLDLANNETGAAGPDGNVDSSGTHFINLSSVITSRDNIRQGVADLINLVATLGPEGVGGSIPVGDTGDTIEVNPANVHFVGHSLGGIVGGTMLGVDAEAVGAATLAMPGGGIARLLDGSAGFGPRISQGLAANGVDEGTDTYETFLRFAQTIVDSADPLNHAQAAGEGHPLHMIEVAGGANGGNNPPDLVVPNSVTRNNPDGGPCPAAAPFVPFLDTVCEAAPLSGTDPLARVMGLSGLDSAPIAPPYGAETARPADSLIRFAAGTHSSILDPSTADVPGVDATEAARTTCEMQRQTVTFLGMAAAGAEPTIPIGPEICPSEAE